MPLTFEYTTPPSQDIYNRFLYGDQETGQKGMPDGMFYLKKGVVVPYSYYPSEFLLTTDDLDRPITVQISRLGPTNVGSENKNKAITYMYAPAIQTDRASLPADYVYHQIVKLLLGQGQNEIIVTQGTQAVRFIITAAYYATMLRGIADELYNYSVAGYDRQYQAIFSPTATRLAEPLLSISNMLPDIQMLQLMAMKFAIRAYISESVTQSGVNDFIAGLVQTTPILVQQKNKFGLDASVVPIFRAPEDFSGMEAHVWIPNVAIASWQAFIKYISNISTVFTPVKITENDIIVEVDGELRTHQFDFEAEDSSVFYLDRTLSCYENMRAFVTIYMRTIITICAAGYSWDLIVLASNPLFDFGLDTGPDFIGLPLTGRIDGGFALDSLNMPSSTWTGTKCVYVNGYYTQPVLLNESEIHADLNLTAYGTYDYINGDGWGLGAWGTGDWGI